jgi:polyhydroxybutyrate depolymerase
MSLSKVIFELVVGLVLWLVGAVVYMMVFDQGPGQGGGQTRRERIRELLRNRRAAGQPPLAQPGAPPAANTAGDIEHFLLHQGRRRRYLVHVPRGFDGSRKLPVVLGFHGGGGHAEGLRAMSRLNDTSDRFGFLMVYPDGTGFTGRFLTFNALTCCGYAERNKVDDVGFVRALLDELAVNYPVDSRRVYATGLSNGAMLCYRLAAELSDRITAIAPVAGDMGVLGPVPKRPVPVMHFHGLKDPNALFHGGVGKNQLQPNPHRSIPETIAWWVKVNGCAEQPVEEEQGAEFIRKRYAPPPGKTGAPVILYVLPEGGHNWPGGVDTTARLGTGRLIASVDASTLMWKFFEQFALDTAPGELPRSAANVEE